MGNLAEKISAEKPWALLGVSRRQYDTTKPWKKVNMTKDAFSRLVCTIPPEAIKILQDQSDAEKLLEAVFGKDYAAKDDA